VSHLSTQSNENTKVKAFLCLSSLYFCEKTIMIPHITCVRIQCLGQVLYWAIYFFCYRASLITCMAAGNHWWTESREPQTSCWPERSVILSVLNLDWVSMSEPHTSRFNVDCASVWMSQLAWPARLVTHIALRYLLPPRVPTVLPYSISFIEQVCPTVKSHLKDTYRLRRKDE